MMSIDELIEKYTYDGKFVWDINSVLKSLRPLTNYGVEMVEGGYVVFGYPENHPLPPPTSEEVRAEWIRQHAIAECLDWINRKVPRGYDPKRMS